MSPLKIRVNHSQALDGQTDGVRRFVGPVASVAYFTTQQPDRKHPSQKDERNTSISTFFENSATLTSDH